MENIVWMLLFIIPSIGILIAFNGLRNLEDLKQKRLKEEKALFYRKGLK